MPDRAGPLGRLLAHMQGEVAGVAVEAYSRAGKSVYELMDDVETRRLAAIVDRKEGTPASVQAAQLCAWNAFALQVLGDELLAADYRCEPRTVGYLHELVAEQALAYYGQVPGWLTRAQQALQNEFYELDVDLPAELPAWTPHRECPEQYLEGVLTALVRMRAHADVAAWEGRTLHGTEDDRRATGRLAERVAAAAAAADYAVRLHGGVVDPMMVARVLEQAKLAVERYYAVGQYVAMPRLLFEPESAKPATVDKKERERFAPVPPGRPDFDRWCLTDPRRVAVFRTMPWARKEIDLLWKTDPEPALTLEIKAQIDAALHRDDVAYESGHYHECPWSAIYVAKRRVRILGTTLHPLQQFTYDVGIFPPGSTHFLRRLLVGTFFPTGGEGWSR